MATRRRDITAPGKDCKGASAHTGTTHQLKRSPNRTTSLTPNHDSTTSEKSIPNYLKPTKSSSIDVVSNKHQGKKQAPSSISHKPTLTRRTSFDKNPSPSHTQKPRISSNQTLRSSSFSGLHHKSATNKNLRAPTKDAGEKHPAKIIRTVEKSTTYIKKGKTESTASATKEQITSTPHETGEDHDTSDVPQPQTESEDQESSVTQAEEETVKAGCNEEKSTKDLAAKDEELVDIEETDHQLIDTGDTDQELNNIMQIDAESNGDEKIVSIEPSAVDQQDASPGTGTKEPEDKTQTEDTGSKQQVLEEHTSNVRNDINTHEEAKGDPNEVVKEKEGEAAEPTVASDTKEEVANRAETQESKETENVVEEKKPVTENATPAKGPQGKKQFIVSNNVIEETASKLREQRNNKVRALAGAFQTVIHLQEAK